MAGQLLLYSVGHSTRANDDFLDLLRHFGIEMLVDIRTIPGSRRHPQFGQQNLQTALASEEIGYVHLPSLGGLRKPRPDSENTGWRHSGFRAYADHMATGAFESGLARLLELAAIQTTTIMCAEALPWRCHRRITADALTVRGIEVRHIMSIGKADVHRLTPFAVVEGVNLTYPGQLELPV